MPLPTGKRSTPAEVALAVLAQLQAFTSFPPERCFANQADDLPFDTQADQVLWLTVEDGTVDDPIEFGAGRVDTRETFTLTVTVRTRFGADETGHDTLWLTDASLGHLALCHKVKDALCEFYPLDADGNPLLCEGLKMTRSGRPRPDRRDDAWGESRVSFKMILELDLDQSIQ